MAVFYKWLALNVKQNYACLPLPYVKILLKRLRDTKNIPYYCMPVSFKVKEVYHDCIN